MSTTTERPRPDAGLIGSVALIVLVSLPLIFWNLGGYSLVNGDEGFYHYVARHMVRTGDWTHLEFAGGEHRVYDTFMNAPIQYWARATLIVLFGDSYWTMRFLSALFGLLAALMTWRLVLHVAGRGPALAAALIQLTTLQFLYLHGARTGELEPVLCFLMTAACYLFLRAIETGRGFWLHHLCLAALVDLKLPIVIVPVAAEALWFACTPSARRRIPGWIGTGLAVVPLALAWHAAQYLALGDKAVRALSKMGDQAAVASGRRFLHHSVSGRFGYYARHLLHGGFPWSAAYVPALVAAAWGAFRPAPSAPAPAPAAAPEPLRLRLLVIFPLTVLAFFSWVSKHMPWYAMPAYPFLSALVALWLFERPRVRRPALRVAGLALAFALLVCVRVDFLGLNPFADPAVDVKPRIVWRALAPLGPVSTLLLVAALAAAVLALLRSLDPARCGPRAAAGLGALLLAVALARVVPPLRHLDHRSDLEALRIEIDAKRARGERLEFPIPVPPSIQAKLRYFFGDDFVIGRAEPGSGHWFELVREGRTAAEPEREPSRPGSDR